MSAPISEVTRLFLVALATRFEFFCRTCIKIEGAEPGSVYPFVLNRAQRYLLAMMVRMLIEVGFVDITIVKGRQQGISTLIEIFLFWLAIFIPNTKICIISHEADSASALFQKVEFAHENLPDQIRPGKVASTRGKELILANKSRYIVLTAGTKESGRSQTAHHMHESERAFFPNPDAIDAGAGQIIRQARGSYKFRESTANGFGQYFHDECLDAMAGKGTSRFCFIPWHWEESYRRQPRPDFERSDEEQDLVDIYQIDDWQLQWRRDKIVQLKSLRKFRQEYPFTPEEAFQASGEAFFDPDLVARAMRSNLVSDYGALIISCDVAGSSDGSDRTYIVIRRGRQVLKGIGYPHMKAMHLAGILGSLIDEYKADACFVDAAMGAAVVDRLHELSYRKVTAVNFGERASDEKLYANKRAEMGFLFQEWLCDGEVNLPDDKEMAADIASMPPSLLTSNGRHIFAKKEDIKKTYKRSPDILDALFLSFAYPVRAADASTQEMRDQLHPQSTAPKSGLTTRQRVLDGEAAGGPMDFRVERTMRRVQ